MIHRKLTNPTYGGAYVYGRTEAAHGYKDGYLRPTTRRKTRDQWIALIPHHHEGYVEWEEFERIQQMLAENNMAGGRSGAPREGAGLLAGLLLCRRCGRRLTVHYTGRASDVLRYSCHRGYLDNGESKCIAFGGVPIDRVISEQVLRVVEPAAMEAAVLSSQQDAQKRDDVLKALERDAEAARYEARRAQKQYDAADPENRLVTEELERRWNQALLGVEAIERRIEEHQHRKPESVPGALEEFEQLATDLDAVWNHPKTDIRVKKRIVRTLIQDVIADVDSEAGEILLVIHWKGGVHTELRVQRRRRGQCTHTSKDIVETVRSLVLICNDDLIAASLNRNGLRTGRGNRWTRQRVASLRKYHRIPCYKKENRTRNGWMNLTEAAKLLGLSSRTLRLAVERGEIQGEHPLDDGPWIFQRRNLESEGAKTVVARARRRKNPAVPNPNQETLDF